MNVQDVISFILIVVLTIFAIKYIKKQFKKSKTITEKVLYILLLVIYFIPIVLYYLDKWNVPTLLTYTEGMDNERWFQFISNYISTIVATIVSSVLLVLITFKQIEIQKESDNEDKRIQNAPIFKYTIENTNYYPQNTFYVNEEDADTKDYYLYCKIDNIGLNHAKKISFNISEKGLKTIKKFELDKSQSIIKKDESAVVKFVFNYKYDKKKEVKNKEIILEVCYEDLLKNKYSQMITVKIKLTNVFRSGHHNYILDIESVAVEDEIYIDEEKDVNE